MRKLSDNQLLKMIKEANKRAQDGRVERLRFLIMNEIDELTPYSGLAYEYYQEARLCWYMGAFVASIVLAQLTLEETLRSYFRTVGGVQGRLSTHKLVDQAGFADLTNEMKNEGLISEEEAADLHNLRSKLRNPYVHPKDIGHGINFKSDFFMQHMKIMSSTLAEISTEEEAKEAMHILLRLLPVVSRRLFGGGA